VQTSDCVNYLCVNNIIANQHLFTKISVLIETMVRISSKSHLILHCLLVMPQHSDVRNVSECSFVIDTYTQSAGGRLKFFINSKMRGLGPSVLLITPKNPRKNLQKT